MISTDMMAGVEMEEEAGAVLGNDVVGVQKQQIQVGVKQ